MKRQQCNSKVEGTELSKESENISDENIKLKKYRITQCIMLYKKQRMNKRRLEKLMK